MKRLLGIALLGLAASALMFGQAPAYTIKTYAGSLQSTTATQANTIAFSAISGILTDQAGNTYVTDFAGRKVWKFDPNGVASLVIGTNANNTVLPAFGKAANIQAIQSPAGMALDANGNLFIADTNQHRIYKIDTAGIITLFAGGTSNGRYSGDGRAALNAELNAPRAIAINPIDGSLYIADSGNNRIRRVAVNTDGTPGIITTVAGTGATPTTPNVAYGTSGDGSRATAARLNGPFGIAFDKLGNLYIADTGDNRIRAIDVGGTMRLLAGRVLTNGEQGLDANGVPIANIAGTNTKAGGAGNIKSAAAPYPMSCTPLPDPTSACATAGDASPAISPNSASNDKTGFPGKPTGQGALLAAPTYIVFDNASGNVIFTDQGNNRIRMFKPVPGFGNPTATNPAIVYTILGNGTPGSSGLGGPSINALTNAPLAITLDKDGNLLYSDASNQVRKVSPAVGAGSVSFVAGAPPFSGDGLAKSVRLSNPSHIATDAGGNVYVADTGNNRLRMIDKQGNMTTIAGGGNSDGEGAFALGAVLYSPVGVAVTPDGKTIYVAEGGTNDCGGIKTTRQNCGDIRMISGGLISTVIGSGTLEPSQGDINFNIGTDNTLRKLAGLALDASGQLYFSDPGNNRIYAIRPDGRVGLVAGSGAGTVGDGGPAVNAQFTTPCGIAVTKDGTQLFVADQGNNVVRVVQLNWVQPASKNAPATDLAVNNGLILPIAGDYAAGSDGDNNALAGYEYRLRRPIGVALDPTEKFLFIAGGANSTVRRVNLATLVMNSVANSGRASENPGYTQNFAGENVAANDSTVRVAFPSGIATDADSNVFFSDAANNMIRELVPPAATPAP